MQLIKACRRPLSASLSPLRKRPFHPLYLYNLRVARFSPPPHQHSTPPRKPKGGFFRRWRRRLFTVAIAGGMFTYFMDADFVTFGYDLYRRNYDSDGMRDKTVWIIGASSGIGEYMVYDLAKAGASRIIISSRRLEQLERVKAECQQQLQRYNDQMSELANKQKSISLLSNGLTFEQRVDAEIDKLADDGKKDLDPSVLQNIQQRVRETMDRESESMKTSVTPTSPPLECEIIVKPLDILDFVSNPGAADQYVLDLMEGLDSGIGSENARGGFHQETPDIDMVIINAGRTQRGMATDNSQSMLLRIQQINVFGPIAIAQAMVKYWRTHINGGKMKRKNKKLHQIAVTSSVAAILGSPAMSGYSMSKAGITRYMEAMRVELVEDNVDINIVCPGPVGITENTHQSLGSDVGGPLFTRHTGGMQRMPLERCCSLYTTALQYSLTESWISQSPPLLLCYLRQYLPVLLGPMSKVAHSLYMNRFKNEISK